MGHDFFIVDAFIDPEKPFSGNPAAVVLLTNDGDICDEQKQALAAQFNLSETVFVSKLAEEGPDGDHFLIRWLTPLTEVEMCGHGTLAATHALKESNILGGLDPRMAVRFRTKYGARLQCSLKGDFLHLNFPSNKPVKIEMGSQPWLASLLRLTLGSLEEQLVEVHWSEATKKLLIRLESIDGSLTLSQLKPDFRKLLLVDTGNMVRGLIVTQKANIKRDGVHFWSRYFAPMNGINEDPVTGSAHTVLAPYWKAVYEQSNEQVSVLLAMQVSSRSGLVSNKVIGDRVLIGGQTKTFGKGSFKI